MVEELGRGTQQQPQQGQGHEQGHLWIQPFLGAGVQPRQQTAPGQEEDLVRSLHVGVELVPPRLVQHAVQGGGQAPEPEADGQRGQEPEATLLPQPGQRRIGEVEQGHQPHVPAAGHQGVVGVEGAEGEGEVLQQEACRGIRPHAQVERHVQGAGQVEHRRQPQEAAEPEAPDTLLLDARPGGSPEQQEAAQHEEGRHAVVPQLGQGHVLTRARLGQVVPHAEVVDRHAEGQDAAQGIQEAEAALGPTGSGQRPNRRSGAPAPRRVPRRRGGRLALPPHGWP